MRSGGRIGTYAAALEVGHHVGDYWVQTSDQSARKGLPGREGALACARHVATYTLTQAVCIAMAQVATGRRPNVKRVAAGLAISAITHYAADRRQHGAMDWMARKLGREGFMTANSEALGHPRDFLGLGTGAWALDQSWHLFLGVFVPALVMGDDE